MLIATKEECELVQAAMSKSLGLPKRDGVHVGDGIHVVIPETYYPGAPGWTERYSDVIEGKTEFALDLGSFDKIEAFDAKKLDSKELADVAALKSKIDAKIELAAEWHKDPMTEPVKEEPPKEEPPKEEPVWVGDPSFKPLLEEPGFEPKPK